MGGRGPGVPAGRRIQQRAARSPHWVLSGSMDSRCGEGGTGVECLLCARNIHPSVQTILCPTLQSTCDHAHFTEEETEAQRANVITSNHKVSKTWTQVYLTLNPSFCLQQPTEAVAPCLLFIVAHVYVYNFGEIVLVCFPSGRLAKLGSLLGV